MAETSATAAHRSNTRQTAVTETEWRIFSNLVFLIPPPHDAKKSIEEIAITMAEIAMGKRAIDTIIAKIMIVFPASDTGPFVATYTVPCSA